MPAFWASSSTASQPVRTTGLNAMTSTPCWTKERMAEIWFSCSPLASENFRSTPAALAASWMDLVFGGAPAALGPDLREAHGELSPSPLAPGLAAGRLPAAASGQQDGRRPRPRPQCESSSTVTPLDVAVCRDRPRFAEIRDGRQNGLSDVTGVTPTEC